MAIVVLPEVVLFLVVLEPHESLILPEQIHDIFLEIEVLEKLQVRKTVRKLQLPVAHPDWTRFRR